MSFADQLHAFEAKTMDQVSLIMRKISFELFTRIVRRTPVRTGLARGNWLVGIGEIDARTVGLSDASGTVAFALLMQYDAEAALAEVSIYITNSLPYIRRLEDGWSQQAPSGMVKITVAEAEQLLRAVA